MNAFDSGLDEASLSLLRDRLWNMASLLLLMLHQRAAVRGPAPGPFESDGYYRSMFGAQANGADAERGCVQLEQSLSLIGRALDLLAADRYGRCDACGVELEEELLFRRPHVLCCRRCQGALEARFGAAVAERERTAPSRRP